MPAAARELCPGSDIAPTAMASPLYRLLVARYGTPSDCHEAKQGDNQDLTISFKGGAQLTWSVNPTIEYSRQDATLPPGTKPLLLPEAVKALRATETDATGDKGCRIAWSKLSAKDVRANGETEASGAVCNCKARITRQNSAVVKLGFSSAC